MGKSGTGRVCARERATLGVESPALEDQGSSSFSESDPPNGTVVLLVSLPPKRYPPPDEHGSQQDPLRLGSIYRIGLGASGC